MGMSGARGRRGKGKAFPVAHRVHHYESLVRQWAKFGRQERLPWKCFATVGEHPVYFLESRNAADAREAIYLSAGLHGDEPAPPWALLEWAQENTAQLHERPFLIFPCLNPYGLVNNMRRDERGVDLNR